MTPLGGYRGNLEPQKLMNMTEFKKQLKSLERPMLSAGYKMLNAQNKCDNLIRNKSFFARINSLIAVGINFYILSLFGFLIAIVAASNYTNSMNQDSFNNIMDSFVSYSKLYAIGLFIFGPITSRIIIPIQKATLKNKLEKLSTIYFKHKAAFDKAVETHLLPEIHHIGMATAQDIISKTSANILHINTVTEILDNQSACGAMEKITLKDGISLYKSLLNKTNNSDTEQVNLEWDEASGDFKPVSPASPIFVMKQADSANTPLSYSRQETSPDLIFSYQPRSVWKLILCGIFWALFLWIGFDFIIILIAQYMASPQDSEAAGRSAAGSYPGILFIVTTILSVALTISGKLPGTKKICN
jgi:hypothetical protein